jgi:hypothetical protein
MPTSAVKIIPVYILTDKMNVKCEGGSKFNMEVNMLTVLSNTVQYNCCERVTARILDISELYLLSIGQNIKVNLVL